MTRRSEETESETQAPPAQTASERATPPLAGEDVLLVDDHPLVGASLRQAVERLGARVRLATNLEEARQALAETNFDALLLDIDFPEGSGTDLFRMAELAGRIPWRCCLISGASDPDELMLAFDEGALGYISKSLPFDSLVEAIRAVLAWTGAEGGAGGQGEPVLWDQETSSFQPVSKAFGGQTLLSPREREVFRLMREGLPDKEIAHRVGRSIHTVRVQIRAIRRKRGRTRRAESVQ